MTPTKESSNSINPFLVRPVNIPAGKIPAEPSPIKKVTDSVVESGPTEPPIDIYAEKNGHPYLVDVLDIKAVFGKTNQESQIQEIDSYLIQQINEHGLKANKQSYEAELSKIESALGIDSNLDYPERIDKIATYVEMLNKQGALSKLRKLYNG